MDERILKHAKVLVEYCLTLKPGEKLMINGEVVSLPLIRAVYQEALNAGALIQVVIDDTALREKLLKFGNDEQLTYVPESVMTMAKSVDALISILGTSNTRMLSNVPPENVKKNAEGRSKLMEIFFDRMGKGELRWCGTQFPTEADAQEASMSLSDYEDFVYTACHLDSDDPVAEWKRIHDEQQKYVDFLNTKKHLRIVSEDTDIEMSIEGRKWINSDGHVNFPSGEVFTGPVEDTVNGHIRFSFPGIYQGREIEDIRLTFENGKVVKAEASKGQELLEQLLEIRGARYVGEIAMGTNYNITRFTKNMLFDEKIGGTVHLALGRSYPETGGKNESDIHWDMLCDMRKGGEIYADGELIYKDGKFLI
ncbi:aminopeptidase [Kosmotoga pacifica]|uniref:Peptidase M29 n=1 Tax=Kosmotoga pacifica TaxID=1330330 RepID=A0A0G2ZG84_9BACT|nr:aminopeptidase [Kosmotoga pacifica]AKI97818.1 peptidase M29 [Kosmotoga pacifica]